MSPIGDKLFPDHRKRYLLDREAVFDTTMTRPLRLSEVRAAQDENSDLIALSID